MIGEARALVAGDLRWAMRKRTLQAGALSKPSFLRSIIVRPKQA
jgi:hypothetical protein